MSSSPAVPYLSLRDLYMKLGILSAVVPATDEAMMNRARRSYVDDEFDSPHKLAWNLSYHASSFPGDPADACSRALIYRMMNIPSGDGPMPPWVTATGEVGKAIEMDLVDAWFKDGRMLAIPEDPADPSIHQLGFVDSEHWLTGSTDLPILPKGWRSPHIVECKAKDDEVLVEMLQGIVSVKDGQSVVTMRQPDKSHVIQLKTTIGLAHEYDWGKVDVCASCWRILHADVFYKLRGDRINPAISPQRAAEDNLQFCPWCDAEQTVDVSFELRPPTTGEIYYASRSWPMGHPRHGKRTKTFFYEHDHDFMARGREVLAEARDNFIAGTLPRRASHMQWGQGACQFCRYKPQCRLDEGLEPRKRKATLKKIDLLRDSSVVGHAKSVRPAYSYEETRKAVLDQWKNDGEETA